MARIVIVDDDELVAEIASEALTRNGHMVSAVHDGDEAHAAIAASQPDLVILDYSLPARSGLEILRDIRGAAWSIDVPVMMLTARGGGILIGRAMKEGADDYVTKPFEPADLVARVEALLLGARVSRRVRQASLA